MDRVVVQTTLAALGGLILLLVGVWLGGHPESLPGPLRENLVEEDRDAQAELAETIKDNFFKEVDEDKLDEGALDGMVRALGDRFSQYIGEDEAELFRQSVSGEFEGVGLGVEKDSRGLLVVRVFDGSPAQRAGIHKNDVVVEVNGESIAGEATQVATGKIKGRAGTMVELTVLTPSTGKRREFELKRARIETPVVEGRIAKRGGRRFAYVELLGFSDGAHGELRQEIDGLRERGAEGVLLDLRGNPGGLLREAVLVASVFVEDGEIVSTRGRTKPEHVFEAEGDAIDESIPVVVLVDNGSASASEIVTGALRDTERATIVGRRTFGKGVFQEVEELSNGALLDLTVGSYYLPDGENISDKGIRPEVRAYDKPRTKRDEALPAALGQLLDELE